MSAPFTTSRAMAMTLALQSMEHHHRDKASRRHLVRRTRQAGRSGD